MLGALRSQYPSIPPGADQSLSPTYSLLLWGNCVELGMVQGCSSVPAIWEAEAGQLLELRHLDNLMRPCPTHQKSILSARYFSPPFETLCLLHGVLVSAEVMGKWCLGVSEGGVSRKGKYERGPRGDCGRTSRLTDSISPPKTTSIC